MNVFVATTAFFESFANYFPNLKVIKTVEDIKKADLIIFTGGEDINPSIYGQNTTNAYGINRARDDAETNIFSMANGQNKFMLGVCRGHQLINALLRGRLYQDLYIETGKFHPGSHTIDTQENSIVGKNFTRVNSMHHQAVCNCGKGLEITGSYQGIIESCEGQTIITVQFHPEFMEDRSIKFFNDVLTWTQTKINPQTKNNSEKEKGLNWTINMEDLQRRYLNRNNTEPVQNFFVPPGAAVPNYNNDFNTDELLAVTEEEDNYEPEEELEEQEEEEERNDNN